MPRSLRGRLVLSLVVVVVVTLAAAAVAFYARLGGYRDDLSEGTLRQVAAPVYYNLTLFPQADGERAIVAGRRLRSELKTYLQLQAQETGVTVLLIDENGAVIPDSTQDSDLADERFPVLAAPVRQVDFRELPLEHHVTSEGRSLVYVEVPTTRLMRTQPASVFGIVVALPESSRRDVFADLTPLLLFAGAAGIVAALAAGAALSLWLYRPLGRVVQGIRAMAAGHHDERVPEQGPSEVRALAHDVNTMAGAIEQSQRALREFLANVSHELRTPLTSIRGFADALLDGTLDTPEERARAARVIDAESRRVLRLVGELLDLSRIESGQIPMRIRDVPLSDIFEHVIDVFSLRAAETGVALTADATELVVQADFDRIEQVLGNLVDNAFRHTPRGGHITMSARANGRSAEITVRDDGSGLSDDDVARVFDRFYRSAVEEPGLSGAGLGLAISREIVRAHGGAIEASRAAGGGAQITFTLPLAAHRPVGNT